jgi:bifunctional enzyme CysN/CysC
VPPALLRIATAGSVDDGKSTLIGRLLYDAKALMADQVPDAEVDLARLTDGLRAEREQGITIDVAYRFFATPRRSFIIADTPGHVRYTRNMVTGASTAQAALVLVDAVNGLLDQSHRHAYISALLGIRHMVACVNKMDLVDWDEERFREISAGFQDMTERLGVPNALTIPMSALKGDNVVERSSHTPYYEGPPLLEHLEQLEVASDRNFDSARFPVQLTIRARGSSQDDYRGYAGQMAGGVLRPGDEVVVLPTGDRTTIERIDGPEGPVEAAFPPMSVTVLPADDLDVSRGDLVCHVDDAPPVTRRLQAQLCWMTDDPLRPGQRFRLKHTSRRVRATVESLDTRLDVRSLREISMPDQLNLNDIGRAHLSLSAPLMADLYEENRVTGGFILIDETTRNTVAAGMVVRTYEEAGPPSGPHSPNIVWHEPAMPRRARWGTLGLRGATVWLTGLPASGKSTIAEELERQVVGMGRPAYLLDGENVRHGLSSDLGFSAADRHEHARRVASVARMFADAGLLTIVSVVSPARADREWARALHEEAGLAFVEAWVDTPLEECERRDPHGLYARARAGRLPGFTGVGSPYEEPEAPDVRLHGADEPVSASVERLLEALERVARP